MCRKAIDLAEEPSPKGRSPRSGAGPGGSGADAPCLEESTVIFHTDPSSADLRCSIGDMHFNFSRLLPENFPETELMTMHFYTEGKAQMHFVRDQMEALSQ